MTLENTWSDVKIQFLNRLTGVSRMEVNDVTVVGGRTRRKIDCIRLCTGEGRMGSECKFVPRSKTNHTA